jgi:hypothetical protein
MNDVLSLKKEMASCTILPHAPVAEFNLSIQAAGAVENIVPLLFIETRNTQSAVEQTLQLVEFSINAFEKTSRSFLDRHKHDQEVQSTLQKYVAKLQTACTGNLLWRYLKYAQTLTWKIWADHNR